MADDEGAGRPRQPARSERGYAELDPDQWRARAAAQVRAVVDALGGADVVGVHTTGDSDDPADFRYLYRKDHVLVRDQDVARVTDVLGGGTVVDGLVNGLSLFELPGGLETLAALTQLDTALGVGVATPDHVLHICPPGVGSLCPANEPEPVVDGTPLTPGWVEGERGEALGRGAYVSVVDTGWTDVTGFDSWLAGVDGDADDWQPVNEIPRYGGHGTFIAGVIRSIAPAAEVRVEGFLRHGGAIFESAIVVQLLDAIANGPDVISLSAGSSTRKDHPLLSFDVFYENHLRLLKGTVLVAAAGNDGTRRPFWPAAFPWTVSVGALKADGTRADFTNFGSWVDVYARGVDLVNAFPQGTYVCQEPQNKGVVHQFTNGLAGWSGTSFSTPIIAGLIAARMSITGDTAHTAANWLMTRARRQSIAQVGPWLQQGDHQ